MAGDLIIRGGVVVDGTRAPGRRADVVVADGRIAEVGDIGPGAAKGAEVLDADGLVVMPGVVDPHTHLDAQLSWDPAATPSCLHGVTTVVTGLCGFGVAPCPEGGGEYLLRSLEEVEEIPFESTSAAVPFEWSSFADWLAYLESRPLGVNVGTLVPHSALRFAVMGERARGDTATDDDRAALAAELRRSLAAGALGFASSRGPNHKDAYGDPVPSRFADDGELRALVGECRGRPWQINVATKFGHDAGALLEEVGRYTAWTVDAGARLSWTPFHAEPGDTVWQEVLAATRRANAEGVQVAPQVAPQPITTTLRFDRFSYVAFVPGWSEALAGLFDMGDEERMARLADPAVRERLRAAPCDPTAMFAPCMEQWLLLASPSRPDLVGRTLAAAGSATGAHPVDLLCDLVVADRLATVVQVPALNRSADGAAALVADDVTLVGLGDSGAHVTSISNYSYPTDILARLVRDESRLSLEEAVHRITARPAAFLGIPDRGVIRPGAHADLAVVDLERLALGPVTVSNDLPGGAPRLYQGAEGWVATVVNGTVAVRDGALTGSAPGHVVRA